MGASALGLAAALLACEGFYRLIRVRALSPTTHPSYVQHDPVLGWSYRPHARERHQSEEFDVDVRINAHGFRGRDWGPKQADRPRILVLGDSYAFGWGVAQEERCSEVLERLAPDWEVLNAAVSGYGTDQELLLLEKLAPEIRPDLVVVVFCENDLFENGSANAYGKHKPYFEVEGHELRLRGVPVAQPWLERASYLHRAISKARWRSEFARRAPDPDREWLLACDLFRGMRRVLGNVPLVVVSREQRLADLAREEPAIHHLDLRAVLAGEDGPDWFPVDGHWTVGAHAKIAEALAPMLGRLLP